MNREETSDRIAALLANGQSCWMDDLTRQMIIDGELQRRIHQGVRGITSNPAIFAKSFEQGAAYDRDIATDAGNGLSAAEIYEDLTTTDARNACDLMRSVYDASNGEDGFVSLEVSPHLGHDTEGSLAEARRLWTRVDRPNLFIKIPGTAEGAPAIEQALYEGINITITLLFSIESYKAVAEAYLKALERRLAERKPIARLASVASFFLSRIDVLIDELLAHRPGPDAERLRGRAGVANAKLAYQSFKHILESDRWTRLAEKGARPQRMLWASTSTKNPAYKDLMYVEPLIGPMTINTMPEKTISALMDHGVVKANTVEDGVADARRTLADIDRLGISFAQVTAQLENEGIQKFIEPFDALMQRLDALRKNRIAFADIEPLQAVATRLRRLSIEMTTAAGSGHPTSCLSCADLIAALFFHEMRWDPGDAEARNVDSFVLSKGHAAPILWAALHEAGAISEDLLTLRKIDSTLEGHPTASNPWVKVATGSLGQGLPAACGIAAGNRLDNIDARVFCLLGDGECSEGSVWEAAQFASLNHLSNLVAIVDLNGFGQSDPTPYAHDSRVLARRFEAFGWRAIEIDGHNMMSILRALETARGSGPTAIIARTLKGKGVSFIEDKPHWHGKTLDPEQMQQALAALGDPKVTLRVEPRRVGQYRRPAPAARRPRLELKYAPGDKVATRTAFGTALEKLGEARPEIVALDGDVKNSTGTEAFAKKFPDRFFESFIAEQNMVGVSVGLAASDRLPFLATFACFLTRAYDFIRMAQYGGPPHMIICGSHAGVSIGEDGPSQMGLEDMAMFRALIESTVLYPADAVAAERLTEAAADAAGIIYIRTTRPKTDVIYSNEEAFPIGGSKVLRASNQDRLTIVAAGITLYEALAAHERLIGRGVATRVIDAYSIKPLDEDALRTAAHETGQLIVVEDHALAGGLGEAVAAAVGPRAPVHRLAVQRLPHSGKEAELLDRHGISRGAIEELALRVAS